MTLQLAAEPGAVAFDPARSAVCVVDMQNHDIKPGGCFDLTGVDTTHGAWASGPAPRSSWQRSLPPVWGVRSEGAPRRRMEEGV